jgi:hypothetical protein
VEERSITNHRESLRRLSQKYGSKTPCFIPCPWPRPLATAPWGCRPMCANLSPVLQKVRDMTAAPLFHRRF